MYYIYHIEGIKIGCSMYPKRRVKVQGYDIFEILEQHIDKNTASIREIELQKQYGYSIDRVKYNQVDYSVMGKIAGNKAVATGHIQKIQKEGTKIAASLPRSEEQLQSMEKARKIGAPIAWALARTESQLESIKKAQKIGCIEGGKVMGAIMKEKLRVPIAAFTKSDNSHVGNYISVTDCARALGLRGVDIFNCLNPNKTQYSTKGYTFIKLKK
jgi:hypothetical protein